VEPVQHRQIKEYEMEEKINWTTFGLVALVLFIIYSVIKQIVDPTPCYPGEVVEYNGGRSAGICQTTYEEYDAWAQKHLSYDKYLKWRESVKDELEDYDE